MYDYSNPTFQVIRNFRAPRTNVALSQGSKLFTILLRSLALNRRLIWNYVLYYFLEVLRIGHPRRGGAREGRRGGGEEYYL